jgi:hypothetical protein
MGISDINITSLRGGLNTTEPPTALDPDQCLIAENVDFNFSTCGERRGGCAQINTSTSFTGKTEGTFCYRHLPTADEAAAEIWAVGATNAAVTLARKTNSWSTITPSFGIFDPAYRYDMQAQTLHGMLFWAARMTNAGTGIDRLHVWTGSQFRPTGMAAPTAAPTAVNDGGGAFIGTRYYRVRYIERDGSGNAIRRSEPSPVLTFVPSGAGSGVKVTKPAGPGEGETHWELEASIDNNLFYVVDTNTTATSDKIDTTVYTTGYSGGRLSEPAGDYSLQRSVRFVVADQDRLVLAGSFEDETAASRVWWTPVKSAPGVGNLERVPISTDNYFDLDTSESGPITGMSKTIKGYIHVFKASAIYRLVRTGLAQRAYNQYAITKIRGAVKGSVVEGVDWLGRPVAYFLDPRVGACMLSSDGVIHCGGDIYNTWGDVNLDATVVARGLFYSVTHQVIWNFASNGSTLPNFGIKLQVSELKETKSGLKGGWSTFTGPMSTALSWCLVPTNIDSNTTRSLDLKPLFGRTGSASNLFLMGDTGTTDNGTAYTATIKSRPYLQAGLLGQFGIRMMTFITNALGGTTLKVNLDRNLGEETSADYSVALDPVGGQTSHTIKEIDNVSLSEGYSISVQVSDGSSVGQWRLNGMAAKVRSERTA